MKQLAEVEEKPFMSLLIIFLETRCRKGGDGRSNASPLSSTLYFLAEPEL